MCDCAKEGKRLEKARGWQTVGRSATFVFQREDGEIVMERGEEGGIAFTVSTSAALIMSRVWRTSTNWNTLFPHISYTVMCQKCAALFFIPMDTERERKTERGRGRRERQGKDLISSWEHANGR